ncbi:MAG: hypothetical protein EOP38_05325 [Rubrivivax sp.]|nr:MAG: hypothetical protein EOP38_05325 [Rubrivivax sp.]
MIPFAYVCTSCQMHFEFKHRSAEYYVGKVPMAAKVDSADLLPVPVRPAWCKDCNDLCISEDIASLRDMENAYGAARRGLTVEYPFGTEFMDRAEAEKEVGKYLRWRMERRHAARVLCCGGSNFQFMDVAQPLFKHADCEFGTIEPIHHIGSYNGPGPGVHSAANIPVYSTEGELIGMLTWRKMGESTWCVDPTSYPPDADD